MKQIAWATFDSYAASILAILSIAVIGRLLTPEEIGIFSTASVFVGVTTVLRDFGVSNYLIQARDCDQNQIDSAAYIAQAIAIIATLFLCSLAYPLSFFYKEPRLISPLIYLGLNLLLIPRISIALAILRREMQFDSVVSITFFMSLSLNIGGIAFAFLGASYMSMVYGSILSNLIGIAILERKDLHIGYKFNKKNIKAILSFGLRNTLINLIRDARSYANEITLAKTQGMAMVAFQSKALSIMRLFWSAVMPGIYSFTLPHFAKEIRSAVDIRTSFLVATGKTMAVALPALVFLAVEGDILILLLNGQQWVISAEVGRWVPAIYLLGFPLLALVGTLLTAGGYMKELVRIQMLTLPPKLAILVSVMYQPLYEFVICNVLIEMIVESMFFAYYLKRCFKIGIVETYRSCFSSYAIAANLTIILLASRFFFDNAINYPILHLATQSLIAFIFWLVLLNTIKNPLQNDLTIIVSKIKQRFSK